LHVLLADNEPRRAASVAFALQQAGVHRLSRPEPGEPLIEAVLRLGPDVVIVNMQRPDRDALDGVRRVSERQPRPIVMVTDRDDPEFMREAIGAGVSSYNVVGASLPDVKPIIQAAIAIFGRFRELESERRRAEASLQDRLAVDRATAMLIRTRACSEPKAYRSLRRQAMRQGRRIAEVAAELLGQANEG
jgi:response regulator NasT